MEQKVHLFSSDSLETLLPFAHRMRLKTGGATSNGIDLSNEKMKDLKEDIQTDILKSCLILKAAGKSWPYINSILEGTHDNENLYKSPKQYHLRNLNVSNNLLTTIPAEIGAVTSLQNLNLENNRLTELPQAIGKLVNLITLNVKNNNLKSVPVDLADLKQLKTFMVVGNETLRIPKEYVGYFKRELKLDSESVKELDEIAIRTTVAEMKEIDAKYDESEQIFS